MGSFRGMLQKSFVSMLQKSHIRSRLRSLLVEPLEGRALLATFYVNGVDSPVQDGSLGAPFATIRQGIEVALQNAGADEVVILPKATGPYTTPVALVPGYSELQIQGYSVFNGDLTIRGGGTSPNEVVIDTAFGDGFYVDAPVGVTIKDLTINQSGRHGILYRSQQPLTVENVQVTNHTNHSGIIVQGANLTVRDSLLFNNYQGIWGGIGTISGTNLPTGAPGIVTIENTVSRNNFHSGVFLREATGVINISNVSANQNLSYGVWVNASASVEISGGSYSGNTSAGIAVSNTSTVSIHDATVSDNRRNGIISTLNQSLNVDGVTVERNGNLDQLYNPGGGGMHVRPGAATPIVVSNSIFRGNRNPGNAGGIEFWGPQDNFIANAIISNSIIENNLTLRDGANGRGNGGGLASIGNTSLTVIQSTIKGNASYSGGGIFLAGNSSVNNVFAGLTIIDSTISNNASTVEGGGITQRTGDIVIQRSTIATNSGYIGGVSVTATGGQISNSTISGNVGTYRGGASLTIRNPLLFVNSTVTDNAGSTAGGIHSTSLSVQFLNSIVAQNRLNSGQENDVSGMVRSLGHNIFGEVDGVTIESDRVTGPGPHSTDIFGSVVSPVNALLGSLAAHGGPTLTHALLPGSPGINGGVAGGNVPATDQRGFGRAGQVDIGAFENQSPVGVEDRVSTNEDSPLIVNVLANDFELDGDAFRVTDINNVQNGTAILKQDGTILFTPNANFNGVATLSYVLVDAAGLQSVTPVYITVVPINDAPVARNDLRVTEEDTQVQIDVLANDSDIDGDTLQISGIVTAPANGTLSTNATGHIVYTPKVDFSGTDSFTYEISDGKGGKSTAMVTVTVVSRQAQMNALKAKVRELEESRVITSRQARTLQSHLKFGNDADKTVSSLTQFQAEVQKLVNSQTLSLEIGQLLIADAEKLKRSVSVFANGGGKGPK
jgi:Bacterial Ig domain/Right handed beta helix region